MAEQEILPWIIEDFNLDPYTNEMTQEQKRCFYKGFSKCYKLALIAGFKTEGVYLFPQETAIYFTKLQEYMIECSRKEVEDADA